MIKFPAKSFSSSEDNDVIKILFTYGVDISFGKCKTTIPKWESRGNFNIFPKPKSPVIKTALLS